MKGKHTPKRSCDDDATQLEAIRVRGKLKALCLVCGVLRNWRKLSATQRACALFDGDRFRETREIVEDGSLTGNYAQLLEAAQMMVRAWNHPGRESVAMRGEAISFLAAALKAAEGED